MSTKKSNISQQAAKPLQHPRLADPIALTTPPLRGAEQVPSSAAMLNEHQAAEKLGIEVTTLRTWRCRKKGPPFFKLENWAIRYDADEIEAYKLRSRHDPVSVRASKETRRGH
jgi:hypothetical protein